VIRAVAVIDNEQHRTITREVVASVRGKDTIDGSLMENVRVSGGWP
jgi:hypothetical protein